MTTDVERKALLAAAMREYRKDPKFTERQRQLNRARGRALAELARSHRDEYLALYAEELARERGRR
jgi:hypothetical protein